MYWITGIAYILTGYETACLYLDRIRRTIFLPLVQFGGRDMILLTHDHWTDAMPVPPAHIIAHYDYEKHTIFIGSDDKTARWPWLSVVSEGRDLSDFFTSLRITKGCSISTEAAILLYAHQKGWLPANELEITLRDGSVEKITVFTQPGASDEEVLEKVDAVNYVK
jgi:hypothetical protein